MITILYAHHSPVPVPLPEHGVSALLRLGQAMGLVLANEMTEEAHFQVVRNACWILQAPSRPTIATVEEALWGHAVPKTCADTVCQKVKTARVTESLHGRLLVSGKYTVTA